MYPRNAPKIVSFPATSSNTMPFVGSSASPITNQAPVYPSRVDGRTRTIYVTSNVDISEWDTHSINAIYALADGPEFENEQEDLAKQPIRSTHSSFYTQATIPESAVDRSEESRVVSSARVNASSAPERLIAMAPAITSTQSSSLCDVSGRSPFPCPWIIDWFYDSIVTRNQSFRTTVSVPPPVGAKQPHCATYVPSSARPDS